MIYYLVFGFEIVVAVCMGTVMIGSLLMKEFLKSMFLP